MQIPEEGDFAATIATVTTLLHFARSHPMLTWIGAVLGLGSVGFAIVTLRYDEFLDCSNPAIHQAANTPLGWSIAVVTSVLPVLTAAVLRPSIHRWLLPASVVVAIIEFVVWVWLLNPSGCDWS